MNDNGFPKNTTEYDHMLMKVNYVRRGNTFIHTVLLDDHNK